MVFCFLKSRKPSLENVNNCIVSRWCCFAEVLYGAIEPQKCENFFKQKWPSKILDSVASRANLDTKLAKVTYFVVALCPKTVFRGYFVVFVEF